MKAGDIVRDTRTGGVYILNGSRDKGPGWSQVYVNHHELWLPTEHLRVLITKPTQGITFESFADYIDGLHTQIAAIATAMATANVVSKYKVVAELRALIAHAGPDPLLADLASLDTADTAELERLGVKYEVTRVGPSGRSHGDDWFRGRLHAVIESKVPR